MANEILPRDENALIQESGGIISADDDSVKVLRISRHDSGPDFKGMLAAAVQMFTAADIIGKIQKAQSLSFKSLLSIRLICRQALLK